MRDGRPCRWAATESHRDARRLAAPCSSAAGLPRARALERWRSNGLTIASSPSPTVGLPLASSNCTATPGTGRPTGKPRPSRRRRDPRHTAAPWCTRWDPIH
jgi:hypothetical protein